MTVITPQPIRLQPVQPSNYRHCGPYHRPQCSIHPEGNLFRQRLYRKVNLHRCPGSTFAPPVVKTTFRRSYMLPRRSHERPFSVPVTTLPEEPVTVSPVPIIEDDSSVEESSSFYPEEERTYKVSFDPQVAVYEIPHHDSYTDKTALWNSQKEIKRQAIRNTIEFTYEHFDWRMAVEEHYFVQTPSGHLIHPAHVGRDSHFFLREQYRLRQREHKYKRQQMLLQSTSDNGYDR